jgi:hypothetical protein
VNLNSAKGAHRIPDCVKGKIGEVVACYGQVSNPLDHKGVFSPLYSVKFEISGSKDGITADVHEDSLEPASPIV